MRKLFRRLALAMVICLGLATFAWAGKPIKTLLITGQNNHNWPVSHVVLEKILENSGLFEVDLAVSPAKGEDMSGFVLDFEPYQLVVLDYNGDARPAIVSWPMLSRAVASWSIMRRTTLLPIGPSITAFVP